MDAELTEMPLVASDAAGAVGDTQWQAGSDVGMDDLNADFVGDEEEGETPEAIGLIGHFEARQLLGHKDKAGAFVGSLDMSMTKRNLISTADGIG